jgi:hypothetical protein
MLVPWDADCDLFLTCATPSVLSRQYILQARGGGGVEVPHTSLHRTLFLSDSLCR